jgi:cytochrome-b5 reductase
MSRHVHSLKPGDTLEFKGPFGKVAYSSTYRKHIGMVAGGTGITPMLQVLRAALSNKEDRTRFTLVFANISLDDVLLKTELDQLAARHPNFQVHYVLQQAPPNWTGSTGFVTKELLRSKLPPPGPDACIFVCGPPPMMNAISGDKMPDKSQGPVQGILKELGYDNSSVYKF